MTLDATQFHIHNVSEFPCVVLNGRSMTPGYGADWVREMELLVELGKPFVVVYEHMHGAEDHEDRKLRGKWLKLNKQTLNRCCKTVVWVEPDEAHREDIRAVTATAVKAFGISHEVVATREEARMIVARMVDH